MYKQTPPPASIAKSNADNHRIGAVNYEKPTKPFYVPIAESKAWFGVSRDTLYRAKRAGHVQIYKIGSRSVLKVSEIEAWIDRSATV